MIFLVVSWLCDAHKIVRWNEKVSFSSDTTFTYFIVLYSQNVKITKVQRYLIHFIT